MGSKLVDNNEYILEIKGLKKYYKVPNSTTKAYLKAVDGIDLKVRTGETLGIVGESGCGKSTLGNLIVKLIEPTQGEIISSGINLNDLKPKQLRNKRREMQIIFQDPYSSLNPRMRIFDIIAEPLVTHKLARGSALKERVIELMEVVGLDADYLTRYPHEFSGGQRQRIGIARALALNPKVIVCDEPVSALDVSIQAQILNLLIKLQKQFDLTLIFIAHGIQAVNYISDQIAVMYLGRIVEIAGKEQIMNHPKHPYTELLLSSVPISHPKYRNEKVKTVINRESPSPVNLPSGCRFHTRCPYADEKCKKEDPNLVETNDGHFVACHYPIIKENR